jgi:hypothetical protein
MQLLLLCVFVYSPVFAEEACKLPDGIKPLRECCARPGRRDRDTQDECREMCESKKNSTNECQLDCYINKTHLIKNGTIDKSAAFSIFHLTQEYPYFKFYQEGTDKCKFESEGSLEQRLVKFYNCIDNFVVENCLEFDYTDECRITEEFYDKCKLKNENYNCSNWLQRLQPTHCCETPQLIFGNLSTRCRFECSKKKFSREKLFKCHENCVYFESGIIHDGKISYDAVKQILANSTLKPDLWKPVIEKGVEDCRQAFDGRKKSKSNNNSEFNVFCISQRLRENYP